MAWCAPHYFSNDDFYHPPFKIKPRSASGWGSQVNSGRRIERQDVRLEATLYKPARVLPDAFPIGIVPIVNEKFRLLVESIEPRIHQFIPALLYRETGVPVATPHWVLSIVTTVDAVIPELSGLSQLEPRVPGTKILAVGKLADLTVDRQKISGLHIWRCGGQLPKHFFFSDTLMDRIISAGIEKIDGIHVAEENVPR
jgi:hypothetical protein